jgi:hypothetical protein
MATFSFDPKLFLKLNNKEKGDIRNYRGSKKNAKGLISISEQFVYKVTTSEFVYKTTFLRKVASETDKIVILKRRKKPLEDLERAELRKQQDPDWKQLVWDTDRESYNVSYIRETEDLQEHLQIDSVVKRGRFNWIVEDIKLVSVKGTEIESIETSPETLHKGHLYGSRLIVKATQLDSPVNRVISKLCALQNQGKACISGQIHETVKTLHATRDKQQPLPLHKTTQGKRLRNKLGEIRPLQRGDYSEHVTYDENGKFVSRGLSVASDNSSFEPAKEFTTVDLGVSEKYKPISLPKYYKEDDNIDKPDAPVTINLSEAEKKLRAMGYL